MIYSKLVSPLANRSRIPGQAPVILRDPPAVKKAKSKPPKTPTHHSERVIRHLDGPADVVRGLGLSLARERSWMDTIAEGLRSDENTIRFRQRITNRGLDLDADLELVRIILERALRLWRSKHPYQPSEVVARARRNIEAQRLRKSEGGGDLVQVLEKSGAVKYYRKVADPKSPGGHRFVFDQAYRRRKDGDDAEGFDEEVRCTVGEKGCKVQNLKSLVTRYGKQRVAKALASQRYELAEGLIRPRAKKPQKQPKLVARSKR